MGENDTASFLNLTSFTTDLNGGNTTDNSDLAPTVQFINNSGKTVRVYNGQVQLTDTGITADDYTLASGVTAFFSGFSNNSSISGLVVRSNAWKDAQPCSDTAVMTNGNVYVIVLTAENANTETPTLNWNVITKTADEFYSAE